MNLLNDLKQRGLLFQHTGSEEDIENLLSQSISLYCGFDPTADSLHIGHLLPILTLKRFQLAGHKPIALVGGATGLIGDPSFKATERSLNSNEVVVEWTKSIQNQLSRFLDFDATNENNFAVMANNFDWFHKINCLDFLRDIGKLFSVNHMLTKDAVKQRLDRSENDTGDALSFTEFSYALLQGFDFAELNKRHNVQLQIGGSDQFGNITWGIETTRKLHQNQVFGITVPLVTKADGTKFGKTESGTIWLDAKKTSPYQFYQFWLKTDDRDVEKYLKFFTFLSIEEIEKIIENDKGKKPMAQTILAQEMTKLVHGEEAMLSAKRISEALFNKNANFQELQQEDFEQLKLDGLITFELERGKNIVEVLVETNLASSKREARQFLKDGAVSVNSSTIEKVNISNDNNSFEDNAYLITEQYIVHDFSIVKRSKKHVLVHWK